jgi:hypothetical protein
MRTRLCSIALCLVSAPLMAQTSAGGAAKAPAAAPLTAAQQIAGAVLPLPQQFRKEARVLGYVPGVAGLTPVKDGKGPFTCLATDPARPEFHTACYHESLEPFMARGRALRASGVKGDLVDSTRFAEVRAGKLAMPAQAATLYSLFGPPGSFDAATGKAPKARPLVVVYMPGATAASTGLSAQPSENGPWIMFPGTPKAHIMFEPKM